MAKAVKTNPSDWLSLYALAVKARDLAPWQWMFEDEIFGLQIPGDPITYYCSIMGHNGEHLSYCFYKGNRGLSKYDALRSLASTTRIFSPMQMLHYQDCMQIAFEDSDLMEPEQKKHLTALGLRFRGSGQWVSVKDFTPGLYPWLITTEQIPVLEKLLTKAMEVVERKLQEPQWFGAWDEPGRVMPVFTLSREGIWEETRLEVNPIAEPQTDRAALFPSVWQYLSQVPAKNIRIACGQLFHNSIVQEKKDSRPYYPTMLMLLDLKEDAILGITSSPHDNEAELEKSLLENLKNMGFRPKKLLVGDAETLEFLRPGCALAGISLALDKEASERINFIAEYMIGMMGKE